MQPLYIPLVLSLQTSKIVFATYITLVTKGRKIIDNWKGALDMLKHININWLPVKSVAVVLSGQYYACLID